MRRVDLANWALRTSPKFTTGVKYKMHQGFWPDQSPESQSPFDAREGVCGNNAVQFQTCDDSSYSSALGEIGCIDIVSLCEIPVWSDDGAGNSLKAEPVCTTKTVVVHRPWWRQNWWKVCGKQFCRTGLYNFGTIWSVPPDVSFSAARNRLPMLGRKTFPQRQWLHGSRR